MKATIYMIVTMLIFSMSIVACKGGKKVNMMPKKVIL